MRTKLHNKITWQSYITHILVSGLKTVDSKQKSQKARKDENIVFQKKLRKCRLT